MMAQVKRYKYQLYKMLKLIIEMLEFQKLGTSEAVDIAKGKYKIPSNFKEFKNQVKWQLQKR
jgi:hypothetical protein